LAGTLQCALGEGWAVEHVGSTSVPGIVAKPVIDVAIRLPDGPHLPRWTQVLHDLGWSGPEAAGDHQALFLHRGGVRAAIMHVFTADEWPQAHPRLFADWLRTHPGDRERYGTLKSRLVQQGVWGTAYTDAKRSFVHDIVNRARSARGLARIELEQDRAFTIGG
jgi:GrpB-like predicted nucleotidyltransferase (UPF0157 family)